MPSNCRIGVLACGLALAALIASGGCRQIAGYDPAQGGDGGMDGGPPVTDGSVAALIIRPTDKSPLVHGQCRKVLIELVGEVQSDSPLSIELKIVGEPTLPTPSVEFFSDEGCTLALGDARRVPSDKAVFFIRHERQEPATSKFAIKARVPDHAEIGIGSLPLTSRAPATAIDAANDYSCAIVLDKAYCWGSNALGLLGDGTRVSRSEPRPIKGLDNVTAIATGENHACAIAGTDQAVYCWGDNRSGQVGTGVKGGLYPTPQPVQTNAGTTLTNATLVTVGRLHSCAVTDAETYCWGANSSGQLGDGTTQGKSVAAPVVGLSALTTKAISSGDDHVCVLAAATTLELLRTYCWGRNAQGQVTGVNGVPVLAPERLITVRPADTLSCGAHFCCATETGGLLHCWGDDSRHQRNTPFVGAGDVMLLGLGAHFGCARASGPALCWGQNDHGQLGGGKRVVTNDPVAVPELATAVRVAGSEWHGCARDAEGLVSCWGRSDAGQLGREPIDASFAPVQISSLTNVSVGAAGLGFTCVQADHIDNGNGVHCWGLASHKQLGDGTHESKNVSAAVMPVDVPPATALSAGIDSVCALDFGGLIHCWGNNWAGQLGRGTTEVGDIPDLVMDSVGLFYGDIALGSAQNNHHCAVSDGNVYCWGSNDAGQIDINNADAQIPSASLINGMPTAFAVAAGKRHSCAIVNVTGANEVACWGGNGFGQCGQQVSSNTKPLAVLDTSEATTLALGDGFSCGIVGGNVKCWGHNNAGQLGDGTFDSRHEAANVPYPDAFVPPFAQIAAGDDFACALDDAGKVMCWGANQYGQRGVGRQETTAMATPVKIPAPVQAIFAGHAHACAITLAGDLYCWGSDATGTLSATWDATIEPPKPIAEWGIAQ